MRIRAYARTRARRKGVFFALSGRDSLDVRHGTPSPVAAPKLSKNPFFTIIALKNAVKTLDTVSHIGYNRQAVLKVRHFSERRDDVRDYFRQNQQGRRELGLTSADKSARLRTACAGLRLMPL